MAIGRITGPMLYSNLDRQGINLQVDTNLAYFDVTNRRLGIGTIVPGYTLDVNGNAHLGNLFILGNTISSEAGANIAGIVSFSSTTNATSTTTGAVIISGGTGIQKDLWVGGNIYANTIIADSTSILAIAEPLLYLSASNPGTYNYETGFFGHFVGGANSNYQHTGFIRNHTDNYWYVFSNAAEPSGSTVNLSNTFIVLDTIKSGGLILANTTPATSTSSGALQVTGGAGVQGALWITNTNDVSANIGALTNSGQNLNANIGAYQTYANANASTQATSINSINANVGAYEIYANANIGSQFTNFNTLNANVGAYHIYANANIGTLFLSNVSTQANIGTLFLGNASTQANIGLIYTQLNTLDANVGLYENTTNANIGTIFTRVNTLTANVGAYENTTNANIGSIYTNLNTLTANVGLYENTANANIGSIYTDLNTLTANVGTLFLGNASTQANVGLIYTQLNTLNANVGAYEIYANTQINLITSNLGSYENTTNANLGLVFNHVNTLDANVGAYENTTNANIGSIFNSLNTLNANVGNYENTTNANIGTIFNRVNSTNANIGAYQIYANANTGTITSTVNSFNANLGAYQIYANANAASQQTQINAALLAASYSNANVASYLPTYSGNLYPGNLITTGLYLSSLHVDTLYANATGVITIVGDGALGLPIGGNSSRPAVPAAGQIRFNSDLNSLEFYGGAGGWLSLNNVITDQQFFGDGVNAVFTLDQVTTTAGILVSMNGTIQQPGFAYNVSGDQLTFAEVPQTSDLIDVRFIASATTSIYNNIDIDSPAITVNTGANTIIDSFSTTTTRSAKYTISSTASVDAHMAEVHVAQFGGTVVLTSYGILNTGANTIMYYANINGSNINLMANGTTSSQVRIQSIYFAL